MRLCSGRLQAAIWSCRSCWEKFWCIWAASWASMVFPQALFRSAGNRSMWVLITTLINTVLSINFHANVTIERKLLLSQHEIPGWLHDDLNIICLRSHNLLHASFRASSRWSRYFMTHMFGFVVKLQNKCLHSSVYQIVPELWCVLSNTIISFVFEHCTHLIQLWLYCLVL